MLNILYILLVICLMGCFYSALMFIRNIIIARHVLKALDIIHEKAKTNIEKGLNWKYLYEIYNNYGTYESMLFDLRKWKFNQFYPNIKEIR